MSYSFEGCHVASSRYQNGNLRLDLWDNEGPVATATINFGKRLPKDQAHIKTYSENEGLLEWLRAAGIVEVIRYEQTGYAYVPLCRIDLEALEKSVTRKAEVIYLSGGPVETPRGLGQFLSFDGSRGTVRVLLAGDTVELPASDCYPIVD